MPKVMLTDAFCRSARAVNDRPTDYADAKERGLELRVSRTGVKSWTFRYRTTDGTQKRLPLGRFDVVPLANARAAASARRAEVHAGEDPVALRKEAREEAVRVSKLENVAEIGVRYFKEAAAGRHRPNAKAKRGSTIALERSYFDKWILPRLGKERLDSLTRARIQALVNDIASAGGDRGRSAARQCKVVLHAIYNFAIWQEIAKSNPCTYVTVPQFQARERVLTDAELRCLWESLKSVADADGVFVSRPLVIAIMLAAVTLQRRAEITGMRRSELDVENRLWTIPGSRTKNHRTHVVPLSNVALDLLSEALTLAGHESEFVFPSPRDPSKPVTPPALSHAFRRICRNAKISGIRPHDLRRTGATALTSERLGVSRFVVSRVLNHSSDSGGAATVTGVYDRNSYLPEKRRALEAWANLLLSIVGERADEAEVVALFA